MNKRNPQVMTMWIDSPHVNAGMVARHSYTRLIRVVSMSLWSMDKPGRAMSSKSSRNLSPPTTTCHLNFSSLKSSYPLTLSPCVSHILTSSHSSFLNSSRPLTLLKSPPLFLSSIDSFSKPSAILSQTEIFNVFIVKESR